MMVGLCEWLFRLGGGMSWEWCKSGPDVNTIPDMTHE
jgi:hypothetical protein